MNATKSNMARMYILCVCVGGWELVMCGWSINVHVLIQTHIHSRPVHRGSSRGFDRSPFVSTCKFHHCLGHK